MSNEIEEARKRAVIKAFSRLATPDAIVTRWFWLSFADACQNLGCTIVGADDFAEATVIAHALGINPGGSVEGVEFGIAERKTLGEKKFSFMHNKLRSRREMIDAQIISAED